MAALQQSIESTDHRAVDNGDLSAASENRLRFWQIQDFFKCPVVGMCLTRSEQQRLLKKTTISVKHTGAFELHELLVASSGDENRLSRRIDALLHRKFGKNATDLIALDGNTFIGHFKYAYASGDYIGALWAAAVHPDLPIAVKREIFGLIHMGMHYSGEERTKMKRLLTRRENELEKSRRRTDRTTRRMRDLRKENSRLKIYLNNLETKLSRADKAIAELGEKGASLNNVPQLDHVALENRALKKSLNRLKHRLDKEARNCTRLMEKNRLLEGQLDRQRIVHDQFTEGARTLLAEMTRMNRCDASCPSFDLCKKRILIVGGISRMESLYRELIEGRGGIFDYHDGKMKKGARRLEYRLKRADMVLCPISCNSHTACSVVKNMAKKHNITVHMLASSSLQAVSRAIWGARDYRYTVNITGEQR